MGAILLIHKAKNQFWNFENWFTKKIQKNGLKKCQMLPVCENDFAWEIEIKLFMSQTLSNKTI